VKTPKKASSDPHARSNAPPRFLSRHQAATDCGVTRTAVIKWISTGALKVTADDKIDAHDPAYIYCREQAAARKAGRMPTTLPPDVPVPSAEISQSKRAKAGPPSPRQLVFDSKQDADIAKIREQITALQLKNEQLRDELVPRDTVKRVFSEIYSVESTELMSLGDRISPEIAAMAAVEKPETVIAIGQLIKSEVSRSLTHVDGLIDRFLASLDSATDDVDAPV
jgi:hypothetical protein